MSAAKHTPGPWVLDWNVSRIDVFSSDSAVMVASVRRSAMSEGIDSQARANARLIAAAPDLLAALVEVTDRLDAFSVSANLNTRLALETARAAIAKATGGAS